MAKDLAEEAAKVAAIPGIIFADGPAGRRARIVGTGIDVFEVIRTYRQTGRDWGLLKESFYWLDDAQLKTALAYYAAFPGEIDGWLQAEAAETLEDFWRAHPSTRPPWR